MQYPRLKVSDNTEASTGCFYQYIYGHNDIYYPHSHEYYEIFVTVTKGVRHWINGELHTLPAGSLVFIRPDDTHGFLYEDEKSRNTEYINLAFTKEIARALFEYLSADDFPINKLLNAPSPPTVILSPTAKEHLLFLLGQLNTINWKNKTALKLRVKTILADVFVQHFYDMPDRRADNMPFWLIHVLQEMEQVENFTAGAERMTELCGKSREHLSRVIKKYMNVTLSGYINKLRVNYAANLLLNSNNSIIDICYLCGFQNLGYFYKVFKIEFGLSPAKFSESYSLANK